LHLVTNIKFFINFEYGKILKRTLQKLILKKEQIKYYKKKVGGGGRLALKTTLYFIIMPLKEYNYTNFVPTERILFALHTQ